MIEQKESFTIKLDELGFTRMPDCFELIIDSEQIISEVDETNNVIRTCSSSIQFDSTFLYQKT